MAEFNPGDKVRWNTPQGETEGTVVEKVTSETRVGGHKVAASDDDPATSSRATRRASRPATGRTR
jgi:hypothetical protein